MGLVWTIVSMSKWWLWNVWFVYLTKVIQMRHESSLARGIWRLWGKRWVKVVRIFIYLCMHASMQECLYHAACMRWTDSQVSAHLTIDASINLWVMHGSRLGMYMQTHKGRYVYANTQRSLQLQPLANTCIKIYKTYINVGRKVGLRQIAVMIVAADRCNAPSLEATGGLQGFK